MFIVAAAQRVQAGPRLEGFESHQLMFSYLYMGMRGRSGKNNVPALPDAVIGFLDR